MIKHKDSCDHDLKKEHHEDFERLVHEYYSVILNHASLKVKNRALAEEITQAVFILFHNKFKSISHKNYLAWLFATSNNVSKNALKIETRRKLHESQYLSDRQTPHQIDNNLLDDLEELYYNIQQLREDQQELIQLRFIQKYSYKEMARILGRSENALQIATAKAQKKLIELIQKRGILTSSILIGSLYSKLKLEANSIQIYKCVYQTKLLSSSLSPTDSLSWQLSQITLKMAMIKKIKLSAIILMSLGALPLTHLWMNAEEKNRNSIVSELKPDAFLESDLKQSNNQSQRKSSTKNMAKLESTIIESNRSADRAIPFDKIKWQKTNQENVKVAVYKLKGFFLDDEAYMLAAPKLLIKEGVEGFIETSVGNNAYTERYAFTPNLSQNKKLTLKYKINKHLSSDEYDAIQISGEVTLDSDDCLLIYQQKKVGEGYWLMSVKANEYVDSKTKTQNEKPKEVQLDFQEVDSEHKEEPIL